MVKRRSWLGLALALPLVPGIARAQGTVVVDAREAEVGERQAP